MRRGLLCVCAALALGCTQDFNIFDPHDGAADSGDASSDACTPSSTCLGTAQNCGQSCKSGYTTCSNPCGSNQNCKAQCKGQESTCFQVCQSTCDSCTADAGCGSASACQTAIGN